MLEKIKQLIRPAPEPEPNICNPVVASEPDPTMIIGGPSIVRVSTNGLYAFDEPRLIQRILFINDGGGPINPAVFIEDEATHTQYDLTAGGVSGPFYLSRWRVYGLAERQHIEITWTHK